MSLCRRSNCGKYVSRFLVASHAGSSSFVSSALDSACVSRAFRIVYKLKYALLPICSVKLGIRVPLHLSSYASQAKADSVQLPESL